MSYSDLPKVNVIFRKDNPCAECKCALKNQAWDNRLKNWTTWMEVRQKTQERIKEKTNRAGGECVMNASEEYRMLKEQQTAIDYTSICMQRDSIKPGFWNMPWGSNKFRTCAGDPTLFAVTRKRDQCIVPTIEYVRQPKAILAEKKISVKKRLENRLWKKSTYRAEWMSSRAMEMERVEPHRPCDEGLIVIGKALETSHEETKLTCEAASQAISEYEEVPPTPTSIPILQINTNVIYNTTSGNVLVNVFMNYDIETRQTEVTNITINNIGRKALRFKWKYLKPVNAFQEYNMREDVGKLGFSFNLKEFIVIPNQKYEIPIFFNSLECGVIKQDWQLKVAPCPCHDPIRIIVKLKCYSDYKRFYETVETIKEKIQNNVRERVIEECLRRVVRVSEYCSNKSPIVYTYDKATLFEAINSSFNPINLRPRYLYSKSVVAELEDFYNRIKLPDHTEAWDLSLLTLRNCTRERELFDMKVRLDEKTQELPEKIEQANLIRQNREELRLKLLTAKPRVSSKHKKKAKDKRGKSLSKSSKSSGGSGKSSKSGKKKKNIILDLAANSLVPVRKRSDIPKTLIQELEDIIKKLHQPMTWKNEQQWMQMVAYVLFCAYFDQMEENIDEVRKMYNMQRNFAYPCRYANMTKTPSRMISEHHDETVMYTRTFFEDSGSVHDQPAQPWVDDIPVESYEKRYRAFHCISSEPTDSPRKSKSKSKGKGKSKVRIGKDKKSLKSTVKGKRSKLSDKSTSKMNENEKRNYPCTIIDYDPFLEVPPLIDIPGQREDSLSSVVVFMSDRNLSRTSGDIYDNNIYRAVYNALASAVDDLEALLMLNWKLTASPNIIQKVADGFIKHTTNDNDFVKIIDLRRIVSNDLGPGDPSSVKDRPCYTYDSSTMATNTAATASESSLWEILRHPLPVKTVEPESGEYFVPIREDLCLVDATTSDTSIRPSQTFGATEVQIELSTAPRNPDCDISCSCAVDERRRKQIRNKLQNAAENRFDNRMVIEGTMNFKFYDDDDYAEECDEDQGKEQDADESLDEEEQVLEDHNDEDNVPDSQKASNTEVISNKRDFEHLDEEQISELEDALKDTHVAVDAKSKEQCECECKTLPR